MAEDKAADTPEEEQESEGGGKSKKKLIIIAGAALLLAGGGGAFFLMKGDDNAAPEFAEGGEGAPAGASGEGLSGPFFYDLKEFVVNLNVGSRSPSFIKMTVALELGSELDVPSLEAQLPRIRDSFHIYIRELRKSDLRGSEGIYRLREELLLRINKITHPLKVRDVLFKEILIQ